MDTNWISGNFYLVKILVLVIIFFACKISKISNCSSQFSVSTIKGLKQLIIYVYNYVHTSVFLTFHYRWCLYAHVFGRNTFRYWNKRGTRRQSTRWGRHQRDRRCVHSLVIIIIQIVFLFHIYSGSYFSVSKIMGQKILLKGNEKNEKLHFFPELVKRLYIFWFFPN